MSSLIPGSTFEDLYGPHFSYGELVCKCGQCDSETNGWWRTAEFRSFMEHLMEMRRTLGFPFHINSGHRCPAYNDALYINKGQPEGTHLDGPHTKGAADIACSFERNYAIVSMATQMGMGVGIHQRGPVAGRYIHVDNLGPRLWTY